jgi:hypothetical protein
LRKSGEFASPSQSMAPEARIGPVSRYPALGERRAWPLACGASRQPQKRGTRTVCVSSESPERGRFLKSAWILAIGRFSIFCIGK